MIKAILFDLDGTLLDNDINAFLPPYFEALTRKLRDLIPPQTLVHEIMAATQAMISNSDEAKTNQQTFADHFFPRIGHTPDELMPIFDEFYEEDFPRLRVHTKVRPEARPLVRDALNLGYDVVIATNPIFPLRAIQHRLDWAEVGDFPFTLVTAYENMHFCKPHCGYYMEIAQKIGREPHECIMVGNDAENDMAAHKVGMATFYIDYNDQPSAAEVVADHQGTLSDVHRLLASWPRPGYV